MDRINAILEQPRIYLNQAEINVHRGKLWQQISDRRKKTEHNLKSDCWIIFEEGSKLVSSLSPEDPFLSLGLVEADLSKTLMRGVTFQGVDLSRANTRGSIMINCTFKDCVMHGTRFLDAMISDTTFENCDMKNASFSRAVLENVNLLDSQMNKRLETIEFSNCHLREMPELTIDLEGFNFSNFKIDRATQKSWGRRKDIVVGVNGIFNPENNTTAFFSEQVLRGDAMISGEGDAILSSLEKAKKAFNTSLSLNLVLLATILLGLNGISIGGVQINASTIYFTLPPIIFGWLYLCNTYLKDAALNYPYVSDNTSAVKVGRFPWVITRYWYAEKEGGKKQSRSSGREGYFPRLLFSFHSAISLIVPMFLIEPDNFSNYVSQLGVNADFKKIYLEAHWVVVALYLSIAIGSLYQSYRLWKVSQGFQFPVLMSRSTTPTPKSSR